MFCRQLFFWCFLTQSHERISWMIGNFNRFNTTKLDMPLTEKDWEQIGSYFQRTYEEGERVEMPDELPQDPYQWLEYSPVIRSGAFPLGQLKYSADKHPPRIVLRKEEDPLSRMLDEAKSESYSESGDGVPEHTEISDFADWRALSRSLLSQGHHEWKVWVQSMVEKASRGEASPKFLASDSPNVERAQALDKWDDLTDIISILLKDRLLHIKEIKAVSQLSLLDKVIERKGLEGWDYERPGEHDEWYDYSTEKISREVVRSMISNSRARYPTDGSEYARDGIVVISVPGITLLADLSKRIASRINGLIKEAIRLYEKFPSVASNLELTESEEKEFYRLIKDGFGNRQGIRGVSDWTPERLTQHNSLKLAYNILNLMILDGLLERRLMTWDEYNEEYPDDESKRKDKRKSYPHMLIFSTKLKDEDIGHSSLDDFQNKTQHPIYRWLKTDFDRWMYCHPKEHRLPDDAGTGKGGLLLDSETISNHSDYEDQVPPTPRSRPSADSLLALNSLQGTQWEINLDFIEALFDVFTDSGEKLEGGIGGKRYRIHKLEPKAEFEAAFFQANDASSDNKRKLSSNDKRKQIIEWIPRIIDHNANVFWHSWAFDFRGRIYPRCRILSPQGDDLDRALVRFKEWKPLGEKGIFWLHVHVHNLFQERPNSNWKPPQKRQSFEDRDSWVTDNLKELRRIANDPEGNNDVLGLNKFSGGKSEAFQRLASVIELDRVWTEYDSKGSWDEVHSGQPVHLDATCSGYQHVAALLRHRELARLVNIIPSDEIMDLYSEVSNSAKDSTVDATRPDPEGGSPLGDCLKENFSEELCRDVIPLLFSRNLAKPLTIIQVYGARLFRQCFEGRKGEGKPDWKRHPKSEQKLEEERAEREAIPHEILQAYAKYESLEHPYYRGSWKWSWFASKVKTSGGSKKDAERYQDIIRTWSWEPSWHRESPLYKALMMDDESAISSRIRGDAELQQGMVGPMVEAYLEAIDRVTGGAFGTIDKKLKGVVENSENLHNSAIGWTLPDGFEVINYYIKHQDSAKTSGGNPAKPGSTYNQLQPHWYKPTSGRRILERLQEVLPGESLDELRDDKGKFLKYDVSRVSLELERIDPKGTNPELDDIRMVMDRRSYNLPRYSDDESERADPTKAKSSITPNFVHSLDAYHLRSVIRRMSDSDGTPDFWAVHDSFGTHPSRMDEMVRLVRETFHEMYEDMDINTWLQEMSPDQFTPVETGDLDPAELLGSEHMFN